MTSKKPLATATAFADSDADVDADETSRLVGSPASAVARRSRCCSLSSSSSSTAATLARAAAAVTLGGGAGALVAFVALASLLEVSLSEAFRALWGACLVLVGSGLAYRANRVEARASTSPARRAVVTALACLVVVAGVLSVSFRSAWFVSESIPLRLGVYGVLGAGVTFCACAAVVETACAAHDAVLGTGAGGPLVSSDAQIGLVVASSLVMGVVHGAVFASVDVRPFARGAAESGPMVVDPYHVAEELRRDQAVSLPVGAALGAASAAVNEALRWRRDRERRRKDEARYEALAPVSGVVIPDDGL